MKEEWTGEARHLGINSCGSTNGQDVKGGEKNSGLGIKLWRNDCAQRSARGEKVAKESKEAGLEGLLENQPALSRRKSD